MNDEHIYAIFDSVFGGIVGFRFYRAKEIAESYRSAYWPKNTYVSAISVEQEEE